MMIEQEAEAYPLYWPDGWERTPRHKRQRAKFLNKTVERGTTSIVRELRRLDARHPVISTNVPIRKDGLPYSQVRHPDDPGVAVYFTLAGRQQCIPCDKWDRVEHNLHAVALTIEALRGLERWGAKQMVQAAFSGFKALPEPGNKPPAPWWLVLKVDPNQTDLEQCELMYRHLAKRHHPDQGGDAEVMAEINRAIDAARKELGGDV